MKTTLISAAITLLTLLSSAKTTGQGVGKALNFDGINDYIQLNSPLNISSSSNTVEAWVQVPQVGTGGLTSTERVGIVLGAYNSSPHFNYEITTGGRVRIYWNSGEVNLTAPASTDIRDGKWHHIAYVRDATANEFRIYIDGIEVANSSSSGSNITMTAPHRIGRDNRTPGDHHFHGNMDEMRIWNYARTETEIRSTMCSFTSSTSSGLEHYLKFEGSDTLIFDEVTNQNIGVMQNFSGSGNSSNRVNSGAAVGNVSIYNYDIQNTPIIGLTSTNNGNLEAINIIGNIDGIHLYRADYPPATTNSAIQNITNNGVFYGVFPANGDSFEYDVTFDYNNFLDVQNPQEGQTILLRRQSASDASWLSGSDSLDTTAKILTEQNLTERREFILGQGQLITPSYPISDINNVDVNGEADSAGILCITKGIVLGTDLKPGAGYEFTIWDGEGIGVFNNSNVSGYSVQEGDSIEITGTVGQHNGLIRMQNVQTITLINSGNQLPAPKLSSTLNQSTNSDLLQINKLEITADLGSDQYSAYNGTDTVTLYIHPQTNVGDSSTLLVGDSLCEIVGIGYQNDPAAPFNSGYSIIPRYFADIDTTCGKAPPPPVLPTAFRFDGEDDYIQLPDTLTINNQSHTVEAWIKVPVTGTGNLDDGERVGIILGSYESRNQPDFNYEIFSNGAPRIWWNDGELNVTAGDEFDVRDNRWHHVAYVRSVEEDSFNIYLDGERVIALGTSGTNVSGSLPHRIGGDNRNTSGGPTFHGLMDELRIWNNARSLEEIRSLMCSTVPLQSHGLLHYYNLDSNNFNDLAGDLNGQEQNIFGSSGYLNSSAPIGDSSVYAHPDDFANEDITMQAGNRGYLNITNFNGFAKGVHIYRKDTVPYNQNGIFDLGNQDKYFGVWVSNINNFPFNFDVKYNFSAYPEAVIAANNLKLYLRESALSNIWTNSGATVDAANNNLVLSGAGFRKEYLLADFIQNPCTGIRDIKLDSAYFEGVIISWTGGSGVQKIQYGSQGFNLGNGTIVDSVSSPHTLSNLAGLTTYDIYVGDSCTSTSSINWVGPITIITPSQCAAPASMTLNEVSSSTATLNVTAAGSNDNWTTSRGPKGFNVNFGITRNFSGSSISFTGLSPETEYDVYIRADCDSLVSPWLGPVTFKTDSLQDTTGTYLNENQKAAEIKLYPNPTNGRINIECESKNPVKIKVLNSLGIVVYSDVKTENVTQINLPPNTPAGYYFLQVIDNGSVQNIKFLKL